MIEASRLHKSYGPVKAVNDVSFRVEPGEVVGFLGPNGAGKSTTLRMLAGFLGPTSGTVRVGGHDMALEPLRARACIGYMPETSPLYPEMRVREYLAFRAELKRTPRSDRGEAVARALRDANVADVEDVVIGHLSKGYRQRVALADALVGSPPVLILDEPTAGLDPNQIRETRALIRKLGEEHTVLVSTHILSEVEATCTRALVISRGRLVAEGAIDEIRALRGAAGARVTVRGGDAVLEGVRAVEGVASATWEGHASGADARVVAIDFAPEADTGDTLEAVVRALVTAGAGVREVAARGDSLEQVFSDLTATDDEGQAS